MTDPDRYKLGHRVDGETVPYTYANVWAPDTADGEARLVIAPSSGQTGLILALMRALPEPFAFLYVSLVPRTDHGVGRFESASVDRKAAEGFLITFSQLFEDDGGHHLWVASLGPEGLEPAGQLVYDQHNLIYAYGPLEGYEEILSRNRLTRVDKVRIPQPHSHHANPAYSEDYDALFDYWDWLQTPLLAEDDE
jgi:hypothetical protein